MTMAAPALIAVLAPIVGRIVGNLFPDVDAKAKAENEVIKGLVDSSGEIEAAAARIIQAEASSRHWLAANWRPLLMLTFGGLIVARWFGLAAPNLSEAEYLKLWDIVQLGIGGYVIGRSVEKVIPEIAEAIKRR